MPVYEMVDVDSAYLAGIIDGEGCITIGMRSPNPAAREKSFNIVYNLRVEMTDEKLIRWIHEATGCGNVYHNKSKKAGHKETWLWTATSRQAAEILAKVRPFLRLKFEQADLFIELSELKAKSNRHGPFNPDRQRAIYERCKELNKRGTD